MGMLAVDRSLFLCLLAALHNFPEGIAVMLAAQKSTAVGEHLCGPP